MYDVTFIGHMCFDEIVPFQGEAVVAPGSAVLCGAMAAVRTGKRIAVVVRMAEEDRDIIRPMRDAGIDVFIDPTDVTTYNRVVHPTADVDVREMVMLRDSGLFKAETLPLFDSRCVHLAGISDREFDLELMRGLKAKGYSLSTDMQSFVRQVDPETREIHFRDVPEKREIISMLDKVKLDVVEGELLTGRSDIVQAAAIIESWGCPEVVVTQSEGVVALVEGREYYEKFSNRSIVGRTGRGDTTFASYLCRRLGRDPAESLKFAAALVSLKMETPGPFSGTLEDVLERMRACHQ